MRFSTTSRAIGGKQLRCLSGLFGSSAQAKDAASSNQAIPSANR